MLVLLVAFSFLFWFVYCYQDAVSGRQFRRPKEHCVGQEFRSSNREGEGELENIFQIVDPYVKNG